MLTTETTELATRVAVFSKPDDVHELADVLTEELGWHPTDAMHEAHSVPCVLTPRLTSANAERIAAVIEQLGLRSEPIPSEELQAFNDLRTAHHVACRLSGLELFDQLGLPAELIPWDDLEVLSVGETPADFAHHRQSTVISLVRHIEDAFTDAQRTRSNCGSSADTQSGSIGLTPAKSISSRSPSTRQTRCTSICIGCCKTSSDTRRTRT